MKIWPSDSFDVQTDMSLEEARHVLDSFVEPTRWFRWFHEGKPFQGNCSPEGFRISRIIRYRNSFLPIVHGTYERGTTGTTIHVHMKLHPLVIAFLGVWFGGVTFGIIGLLAGVVDRGTTFHPSMLLTFGMVVFGIALVSGGFWFEAKKQRPMLEAILQGRTTQKH